MFSSADGSVPPAAAVAAKASERILCISPWSSDLRFLQKVLNAPGRQIDLAETIKQAAKHLAGRDLSLIITETDLPDGTWHDVLRKSSVNGHAPAVLVVCRLADERLWA